VQSENTTETGFSSEECDILSSEALIVYAMSTRFETRQ